MVADDRPYDIVLWGATGFTGRFVAEYLAEHYGPSDLDWAIAGRNIEKLEQLRNNLVAIDSDWDGLDMLVGDAFDSQRLGEIAEQTTVVCAVVGPYSKYGSLLVGACIEHGTDYCDLAGDLHWIHEMIEKHHEAARERGVRIVHACGFDSIPSDLGTLLLQRYAEEQYSVPCSRIKAFASTSSLGLSGGTVAGMVEMYEALAENPAVRHIIEHPYSLTPVDSSSGTAYTTQRGIGYDQDIEQWTAPFAMAYINEKIVHRSNALLGYPWGRDFRYTERTPTGTGLTGAVAGAGLAGGLRLFEGAMSVAPIRSLLDRFILPSSGEGPSSEITEHSLFEFRFFGTTHSSGTDDGHRVDGIVSGERDPYGATAGMIGEAALCLVRGDVDSSLDGGLLTPASGIGEPLVDRLRNIGLTFTVGK